VNIKGGLPVRVDMTTYEYCMVELPWNKDERGHMTVQRRDVWVKQINEQAKDGWRVVHTNDRWVFMEIQRS